MVSVQLRPGSRAEIASLRNGVVLSVDLGFSKSSESTGLATRIPGVEEESQNLKFGSCLSRVVDLLHDKSGAVLLLEAPLSGLFSEEGDPIPRGEFERRRPGTNSDRYWYSGAGASTCLAAVFFLRKLHSSLKQVAAGEVEIVLYEGYVTFKQGRTDHAQDAQSLLDSFLGRREYEPFDVAPERNQTAINILDVVQGRNSDLPAPTIIVPARA